MTTYLTFKTFLIRYKNVVHLVKENESINRKFAECILNLKHLYEYKYDTPKKKKTYGFQ